MDRGLIDALRQAVGAEHVLTGREDLLRYAGDATPGLSRLPAAVVVPASAAEVAKVLALANEANVPVYPRGGVTGPGAGAVPPQDGIVLLTARMNRIVEIDAANLVAVAEPGVAVGDLNKAVEEFGLIYPPDPGTVATATLGGTAAENAGGLRGLKYGVSKHYVLGLEVVLADGRILHTGGKTVKDVAGYDLTKLFTGAAGTLGVITQATVKLVPAPEARQTMLAAFAGPEDAGRAIAAIIAARVIPATLEIMDGATVRAVEEYARTGLPADAAAVLLIEVDGIAEAVAKEAAKVIEALTAANAAAIRTATDAAEREKLWAARRAVLPALAGLRPAMFVADAMVPRGKVPAMIGAVKAIAARNGVTIGTFGHAGDGNLHPTVVYDSSDAAEMERVHKAMDEIAAAARELGGALSGERGGGGQLKYREDQLGPAALGAMRAIKKALDPNCILNPGKLVGECG